MGRRAGIVIFVVGLIALALAATPAAARPGPWTASDRPFATPVAKPGSELASRAGLGRGELRDELAAALADDGSAGSAWVYDADAAGGDPLLFSDSSSSRLIPASNEKLFTTAAFLAELGPSARLETRAYARGRLGGRGDSTLDGDLVIVGDGDPAFGTARFARGADQPVTRVAELARAVAATGVERIKGRILADDSIFDRRRRSGPDLSPLSGLSFNNGYDAGGSYAGAPELLAAKGLKNGLRKRGVAVGGRVARTNLPAAVLDDDPLAEVASPTVAELIEETNVPSNNFFAEMLLKRLAATTGRQGTRLRGAAQVERFARSVGTEIQAVDGSGLSRRNAVSTEQIGRLLVAMDADEDLGAVFHDSLPVAGREGTVADRMLGTAAEGNCQTKTGTLSDVSALSGYCEAGGHTIVFSVLQNRANLGAARIAQDRIAALAARYAP